MISFDALVIVDQCFGYDFGLGIANPLEIDGVCGKVVFQQAIHFRFVQMAISA